MNWVVVESFGETLLDCWIMLKWCFDFKYCVTLSAFLCTYTCKQLLERVWTFGRSKFGFLGEKGLEPVTFFDRTDDWSLSVQQASCKRAITVATVTWSLKRAKMFGGCSELSKMFLSTCLTIVYILSWGSQAYLLCFYM